MISCCFEVVGALGWGEGIKQSADFMPARIDRAVGRLVEPGFELGEELFDRISDRANKAQQAQVAPGPRSPVARL